MKKKLCKKGIVLAVFVLFVGVSILPTTSGLKIEKQKAVANTGNGNTLYVGGSGGGNHTTIQEAINNASNGDTIFVYDDSSPYNEDIETKLKKINIVGEDKTTTTIQGVGGDRVIKITSSDFMITDFTIRGTSLQDGIHVTTLNQNVEISNNIIKECNNGIVLQLTTNKVEILDNTISDNDFIGLQLTTSNQNTIIGNTIENNGAQGVSLALNSDHNSIENNSIANNDAEGIKIEGIGSIENTLLGNTIINNRVGIKLSRSSETDIISNHIEGNTNEGLLLEFSKENIIETNNFIDNRRNAFFISSSRNVWDANYWDDWIGVKPIFKMFPKIIRGIIFRNFDWNPAETPYNIGV